MALDYLVHQIKSKVGSFDYYAYLSSDGSLHLQVFHEAILAASWASIETCEECGNPAKQYTIRLWTWTLCDDTLSRRRLPRMSTARPGNSERGLAQLSVLIVPVNRSSISASTVSSERSFVSGAAMT
ncbi:hypothetical protein [Microbacterium sp. 10M-3C3]|jgi:hypothetical protein|uniref:hypothetical protein n=1 Tax=Microbacterium sp. 10M-3C3 TaxID=2483401 RepID=UPI000F634B7A|nr:hypothetical protein [Microbacterium sp. 10M-3C3]